MFAVRTSASAAAAVDNAAEAVSAATAMKRLSLMKSAAAAVYELGGAVLDVKATTAPHRRAFGYEGPGACYDRCNTFWLKRVRKDETP